jgi:hypothetical protein
MHVEAEGMCETCSRMYRYERTGWAHKAIDRPCGEATICSGVRRGTQVTLSEH